jgi:hypothetical protein
VQLVYYVAVYYVATAVVVVAVTVVGEETVEETVEEGGEDAEVDVVDVVADEISCFFLICTMQVFRSLGYKINHTGGL